MLISKLKQFFLINCSSLVHSHSLWENLVFMSQMHCRHLSIVGSLRKRVCLTHLCIHKIHVIFIHSRGFIYIYTYAGMDEMWQFIVLSSSLRIHTLFFLLLKWISPHMFQSINTVKWSLCLSIIQSNFKHVYIIVFFIFAISPPISCH